MALTIALVFAPEAFQYDAFQLVAILNEEDPTYQAFQMTAFQRESPVRLMTAQRES